MKINLIKLTSRVLTVGCISAVWLLPEQAAAQAMSPMRGQVKSFTDSFALRVFPANPYQHRIRMEVKVYDQHFRPVRARISPSQFTLGGRLARPVNVVVPFNGSSNRKVRICTEAIPFPTQQKSATTIRAQVCGKFLGVRVK